ncbi:MAG: signal recognition particle receptor subunit alpha, partial [Sphaerochaeta sp.]
MLKGFGAKLKALFGMNTFDERYFENLEDFLIEGDLGAKLATQISDEVRKLAKSEKPKTQKDLQILVKRLLSDKIRIFDPGLEEGSLTVYLILGVNGVGKTTSIAKLAQYYKNQGKQVLLAAADTFRAAAIDQLEVHAQRLGCRIVKQKSGSDPGSVVFDAITSAQARGEDLILVDTAGRMHNKENLLRELSKIDKIVKGRGIEDVHYKKFLVIDSTTGQNGISQAELFN